MNRVDEHRLTAEKLKHELRDRRNPRIGEMGASILMAILNVGIDILDNLEQSDKRETDSLLIKQ